MKQGDIPLMPQKLPIEKWQYGQNLPHRKISYTLNLSMRHPQIVYNLKKKNKEQKSKMENKEGITGKYDLGQDT